MDDSVSHVLLERTLAWINRVVAKFKQGLEGGEWKDEEFLMRRLLISARISPVYVPCMVLSSICFMNGSMEHTTSIV